jgi:ribokinase
MTKVLVLGNATVDLVQRVAQLPRPGETLLAESLARCAGGKGLNQAVAAVRTGAATHLVAPVGRDAEAAYLAETLRAEAGLTVDWLSCDAPTDLSSIVVAASGENHIVSSAACARSVTPDQAQQVCAALSPGDVLLLQGNLTRETTLAAARTARARGATCLLNTAPIAWDMRPLLGLCDVVIANEGEADMLAGGAANPAAAIRTAGVTTAIITLGARGALVAAADETITLPAPQVAAVDSSGAGDVFVGTLAGLVARGHAIPDAVRIAIAAASLSVTRENTLPSFPTRTEMTRLLQTEGGS